MLDAYRVLLRPAGTRRLIASLVIGRIPIGIFSLAIVLLVREETGSFAQAGVASAAWAVGAGVLAPIQGRLVDRFGQPAVLVPSTLCNALAVIGLIVFARQGAATWALAAFAFLGGAALPPLSACMRSIWARVFAHEPSARDTAYAFEGVISEAFFVVGPIITMAIVAFVDAAAALILAVAFSVVGTLGFSTSGLSRAWRSTAARRTRAGALQSRGMWTFMLAILPTGVAFGALEVAMPAFAEAHGEEAEFAGVFLSAMAVGSLLGGVWYGARVWTSAVVDRFVVLHVALAVGTLPLLIAHSVATMVATMVIAGLALAPSAAAGYLLIDHVAPPGTTTEATTWMMTANVAGAAAGAALAGVVVDVASVRWALALACAGPVLGAIISIALRHTLRPPRVDAGPPTAAREPAPLAAEPSPAED